MRGQWLRVYVQTDSRAWNVDGGLRPAWNGQCFSASTTTSAIVALARIRVAIARPFVQVASLPPVVSPLTMSAVTRSDTRSEAASPDALTSRLENALARTLQYVTVSGRGCARQIFVQLNDRILGTLPGDAHVFREVIVLHWPSTTSSGSSTTRISRPRRVT